MTRAPGRPGLGIDSQPDTMLSSLAGVPLSQPKHFRDARASCPGVLSDQVMVVGNALPTPKQVWKPDAQTKRNVTVDNATKLKNKFLWTSLPHGT